MPLLVFLKHLTRACLSWSLTCISLTVCLQPFFSFHIFISKPKTDTARQAAAWPICGSTGIILLIWNFLSSAFLSFGPYFTSSLSQVALIQLNSWEFKLVRITELWKESHHLQSQKKNGNMSQGSPCDKQDKPGGLTCGLQSCLISAGLTSVHLPLLHTCTALPEGCQAPSTACPGKPAPDSP